MNLHRYFTFFAFNLLPELLCSALTNNTIVSLPKEYTYLLPSPFTGDLSYSFVNGTNTTNTEVNAQLHSATNLPFISYDDEFLTILGSNPHINLVQKRQSNFAAEAGVWIKDRNEVWYTTWINDGPTHVEILDLQDNSIRNLTSSKPLQNPNGGFLHQGRVYFTCLRDDSRDWPGGIVSVDPENGQVETVLNSYFGLKFDSIDDLAWVTQPRSNDSFLFFTVLPFTKDVAASKDRLPQGLWRFDPQTKTVLPLISRTELPVANGVRASKDQKTLWVTDFGGEHNSGAWGLPAEVGSPAIYKYDLDANMLPINQRLFGIARMSAPDGIRIDDNGRVWTAEGEGIVVRNSGGKVIGVFNAQYFTRDPVETAIVQFALAGDVLVVLGQNMLWTVKLEVVVSE